MHHKYDLFEKFPDGSSLWRACVIGLEGTRLHMFDLARRSSNQFYAMNLVSGKIVSLDLQQGAFHVPPRWGDAEGCVCRSLGPKLKRHLACEVSVVRVHCATFSLFLLRIVYPTKKWNDFLHVMAIQDTDEPSSDRLIEEGRPLLRRLSFFFDFGIRTAG